MHGAKLLKIIWGNLTIEIVMMQAIMKKAQLLALLNFLIFFYGFAFANPKEIYSPEVDLSKSYLVFNSGDYIPEKNNFNKWVSPIKAVLIKDNKSGVDLAFLGKECHAENVNSNPYSGVGNYLFHPFVTSTGGGFVRVGFGLRDATASQFIDNSSDSYIKFSSHIFISNTLEINPKRIIEIENDDYGKLINNLYLKMSYTLEGNRYTIISKVEYLNYPARDSSINRYVQPTIGPLLINSKGRFVVCWLALHIESNGTVHPEFIVVDQVSGYQETLKFPASLFTYDEILKLDEALTETKFFAYVQ